MKIIKFEARPLDDSEPLFTRVDFDIQNGLSHFSGFDLLRQEDCWELIKQLRDAADLLQEQLTHV